MKAVVRKGDTCTGHPKYPPRDANQGSPNVFTNGKANHRKGDSWAIHCKGKSCHPSNLAGGSSLTFVNGKPQGLVGDPVACGGSAATGSPDTFSK